MLRQFRRAAALAAVTLLVAGALAGCGVKGPLKAPAGTAPPPPPPPAGVELPSGAERQ